MLTLRLLLGRSPVFAALEADDLIALAGAFTEQDHAPGHDFIREGDAGEEVYLVVGGEVAVLRGGHEVKRLRPGSLFGLLSSVDARPRAATCRAAGDCRVAVLEPTRTEALFAERPRVELAFHRAVTRQLASDFRDLNARIRAQVGDIGRALLQR